MAQYTLQLDRRTLFGKNMFNFLAGMNCIDADAPNVAVVDERTAEGKRIFKILNASGAIKKAEITTTDVTRADIEKIRELSHRRLAEKLELYDL
ncbi:MAG: hypothetical protein J5651_00275 [Salinivirgaceae bacterium]|nr:hypothetical protein [Salinivirgaceae bacterium]